MKNYKNKIIAFFFILIAGFLVHSLLYEHFVCKPTWEKTLQNLGYIRQNENSINKIRLIKSAPGYAINLIKKDSIISDAKVISKIKEMILKTGRENWMRPKGIWEVKLVLELSNNDSIEITVSKLENTDVSGKTHLYYLTGQCTDDMPSYSTELGDYLEKLTNYNGEKYK